MSKSASPQAWFHLSAFSDDGKYYSQIENDGRCKIWDTETNLLKQEFTPDLHLTAPISCLCWIQIDIGTPSWKRKGRKRLSLEVTDVITYHIAFGTSKGKVLIYSLAHGKVEAVLEDPSPVLENHDINCLDWNVKNGLYSCSSDSTIKEWNLSKNKLQSKFKLEFSDNNVSYRKITAIKLLPDIQTSWSSDHHLLLTACCEVRLWCLSSRRLLRVLVDSVVDVYHLSTSHSLDDFRIYVIAGCTKYRYLMFWRLNVTSEDLGIISNGNSEKSSKNSRALKDEELLGWFTTESNARQVNLQVSDGEHVIAKLAAVTCDGLIHYYERKWKSGVKYSGSIKPVTTVRVTVESSEGQVSPAPVRCSLLHGGGLLLGYGLASGITFEKVSLDLSSQVQVLMRSVKDETLRKRQKWTEGITLIRHGDSNDASIVHLSTAQDKPTRTRSEKEIDVPMESRLANLSLAQMTDDSQGPKTNLAQLLVQALHSKNTKLLQTVFECMDPEIAFNTVDRLPAQYIPIMLEQLTSMLAGKTSRCRSASVWAGALCRARASILMEQVPLTRALLAALAARRVCLASLLALRSRLKLITSLRTPPLIHTPLLDYKDSSSEEEIEEDVVNGDDSGSWNEDGDEDNSRVSDQDDMSE